MVGGGGGLGEPVKDGSALQPAGFAGGLDPFDPAVPAVGLGAALESAHQHGGAHRPLGCVVGGSILASGTSANVLLDLTLFFPSVTAAYDVPPSAIMSASVAITFE